jgi:ribosomal protein S8
MDHLANLLSHIKNAQKKKLDKTFFRFRNKKCIKACSILYDLGYIGGYSLSQYGMFIKLKYFNNRPVIRKLNLCSTKGNPLYVSRDDLKSRGKFLSVTYTFGFFILSTNISNDHYLTDVECLMQRCGGKLLFFVG